MKWFLGLLFGLVIFYRDSFFSLFFQDDFLLLKLSKQGNFIAPIPNFPYRPIAIQAFYSLGSLISGNQPFGFHLLSFVLFSGALLFVYLLSSQILKNPSAARLGTLFYAFNISLFPIFFWVATSYFVLAAFFTFGALYFFMRSGSWSFTMSLIFFLLGLLSNELVLVTPVLLVLINYLQKTRLWIRLVPYVVVGVVYALFRLQLSFPSASDYHLNFGLKNFLTTLRWYFWRIFNLPEGVRTGASPMIYLLFIACLGIFIIILSKTTRKWLIFSTLWFIFGALPFFFLPNHMSSYYLTLSLFGPAVLIGKSLADDKRLTIIFFIFYLLLAVFGLNYLSQTHWIILKPTR